MIIILVVTAWLVSQRSEIRKLESRSNELRQKIELIEERGGLADARGRSDQNGLKPWQEADVGGGFDWKRFAELVRPNSPAHGSVELMRLQRKLMQMDASELIEALNEIDKIDMPDDYRNRVVNNYIMGILSNKAPQWVLENHQDQLNEMYWMGRMVNSLGNWVKSDSDAALAWLDERMVDGSLDSKMVEGKDHVHSRYISAVVGALMAKKARQPFGKVKERQLLSFKFETELPLTPKGEYFVIQFQTLFENGKKAVETITPMKEGDDWKVSGYYIK